jgi:hypothetical protein
MASGQRNKEPAKANKKARSMAPGLSLTAAWPDY